MRWRQVLPTAPWRGVKTQETGQAFKWARSHIVEQRGSVCPDCGQASLHPVQMLEERPGNQASLVVLNTSSQVYLECKDCGYTEDVTALMLEAANKIDAFAKMERNYAYTAIAMFAFSLILALWIGNPYTLIGGSLLALMLVVHAFNASYRRWQIINSRMYEQKAPIGDFLRDLFGLKR